MITIKKKKRFVHHIRDHVLEQCFDVIIEGILGFFIRAFFLFFRVLGRLVISIFTFWH